MKIDNCIIGKRIKIVRQQRGLSQTDLGNMIGKSGSYLSYIERGEKSMSIATFVHIANALQLSADGLLVGDLANTSQFDLQMLGELLSDCSEFERRVLIDSLAGLKEAMRSNRGYLGRGQKN